VTTSLEWIRRKYNVPAFKGLEITYRGEPAVIACGQGPYLRLRVADRQELISAHPTDGVVYPVLPLPHLPRGWCDHCGGERALRADGTLQRHVRPGAKHFAVDDRQCPGACKKPWAVCSWTVPMFDTE
jgi:hypothetical protein